MGVLGCSELTEGKGGVLGASSGNSDSKKKLQRAAEE